MDEFLIFGGTAALIAVRFFLVPRFSDHRWLMAIWVSLGKPLMYGYVLGGSLVGPAWGLLLGWLFGQWTDVILSKVRGFFGGNRGNVLRGAQIVSAKQAIKWLGKDVKHCHSKIGDIPVPASVESTGFLFSGTTGTGKSLAFTQMLTSARARGHAALISDLGGEFVSQFYRDGQDTIINPFDKRGKDWSPFAEMRNSFDASRIASSMIPEGLGEAKEWNGYARAVLETILERLYERGEATNQSLCYYTLGADGKELGELCRGSAAESYFSPGNERMLGSIRGILSSYLKPYTYLNPASCSLSFSIRRAIETDGGAWLFLSYRLDQLQALRPMIAAQIDIAATALLSTKTALDRRFWFALDEFPTLGYVNSIGDLLTLGRKKGACTIMGIQSIAQVREVFGKDKAQTILACLGTWLVLKQPDAESAEYMSLYIGEEEISRMVDSESSGEKSTTSKSEQIVRQRAIMPTELQNLSPRVGIVNIAGPMPPAWTGIALSNRPAIAANFDDVANPRAMRIERPAGQVPRVVERPAKPAPLPAVNFDV